MEVRPGVWGTEGYTTGTMQSEKREREHFTAQTPLRLAPGGRGQKTQ